MNTQNGWTVQVIRCRRKSVGIRVTDGGEVVVRAPLHISERELRRILESKRAWIEKTRAAAAAREQAPKYTREEIEAFAQQALETIPPRVRAWAQRLGVTFGRITIRNQRSRWGSCSSKGNLNFNCLLMLAPPDVLDYVIVHELCHRKELNHSPRFWAEVERVLPDYKKPLKWLKSEGQGLIARL